MTSSIQDFATAYGQAWAQHDPDAIVAMHTPDTVFHQHGIGEPAVGSDAVREAITEVFALAPDLAFDPRRMHFGDDHFVSEYEMSGTAGGRSFACDGVDVFTLRDGLVARKDTYVDLAGLMRQTGMDPTSALQGAS